MILKQNDAVPGQTICQCPFYGTLSITMLTILLLNTTHPVLANSVDPDHLASEEAN